MSYLSLIEKTLDLKKATISVWFRVPKTIAQSVTRQGGWDFESFSGVIPLVVIGPQINGDLADFKDTIIGYQQIHSNPDEFQAVHSDTYDSTRQCPLAPTFLGILIQSTDPLTIRFVVHIQTTSIGSSFQTSFDWVEYQETFVNPPGYMHRLWRYENVSNYVLQAPDSLGNYGHSTELGGYSAGYPDVTADEWHHALISWDLSGGSASHGYYWGNFPNPIPLFNQYYQWVDSFSLLYCALDDKNLKGDDENGSPLLPGMRFPGMAANATISYNAYVVTAMNSIIGPPTSTLTVERIGGPSGPPTYSVNFSASPEGTFVPSQSTYQISYPAGDVGGIIETIKPIAQIEMAELQIFGGFVLDTGDEAKRRAFIDYDRDENGDKIPNESGKFTLKPVDPKKTAELLGRQAHIVLHGSSNWINGENTGSLGYTGIIDTAGNKEKDPEGQFVKTGTINKYKPDPSIEE
jgi:hypothetical protein